MPFLRSQIANSLVDLVFRTDVTVDSHARLSLRSGSELNTFLIGALLRHSSTPMAISWPL